jgi:hypothetical protein
MEAKAHQQAAARPISRGTPGVSAVAREGDHEGSVIDGFRK